jgi:hypothetical protein
MKATAFRRTLFAVVSALAMVALTVGQAMASGGSSPFPK